MVTRRLIVAMAVVGCFLSLCPGGTGSTEHYSRNHFLSRREMRDEVLDMFYHAYGNYREHSFPHDELQPLSCSGDSSFYGGLSLSMLDALDTLAIIGDYENFTQAANVVGRREDFDVNVSVSVFETNIRIVGGLLSAHMLAADEDLAIYRPQYANGKPYNGFLLRLAKDLADRLLPAFDTPTGIPYGSINLKYGIKEDESTIVCTAAAGTFVLEFGVLSRLLGDPVYEQVARRATRSIFGLRSEIGLVGGHVDIESGVWTQVDSGIGSFVDSYFEYLWKAYILFEHPDDLIMWTELYTIVEKRIRHGPWYIEAHMKTGQWTWPAFSSLQGFWPGLLATWGASSDAAQTMTSFFSLWQAYGFAPERYDLMKGEIIEGFGGYPLRPEFAESLFFLHRVTRDPVWLKMGREMVSSLQALSRVDCGYASIDNVLTNEKKDWMDSFFLSETLKYLFLLFTDEKSDPQLSRIVDGEDTIFTTEAHPISRRRLEATQVADYQCEGSRTTTQDEETLNRKRGLDSDDSYFLVEDRSVLLVDDDYTELYSKARQLKQDCPRPSDIVSLRTAYVKDTATIQEAKEAQVFHSPQPASTKEREIVDRFFPVPDTEQAQSSSSVL